MKALICGGFVLSAVVLAVVYSFGTDGQGGRTDKGAVVEGGASGVPQPASKPRPGVATKETDPKSDAGRAGAADKQGPSKPAAETQKPLLGPIKPWGFNLTPITSEVNRKLDTVISVAFGRNHLQNVTQSLQSLTGLNIIIIGNMPKEALNLGVYLNNAPVRVVLDHIVASLGKNIRWHYSGEAVVIGPYDEVFTQRYKFVVDLNEIFTGLTVNEKSMLGRKLHDLIQFGARTPLTRTGSSFSHDPRGDKNLLTVVQDYNVCRTIMRLYEAIKTPARIDSPDPSGFRVMSENVFEPAFVAYDFSTSRKTESNIYEIARKNFYGVGGRHYRYTAIRSLLIVAAWPDTLLNRFEFDVKNTRLFYVLPRWTMSVFPPGKDPQALEVELVIKLGRTAEEIKGNISVGDYDFAKEQAAIKERFRDVREMISAYLEEEPYDDLLNPDNRQDINAEIDEIVRAFVNDILAKHSLRKRITGVMISALEIKR